jgi:hypothetical protein
MKTLRLVAALVLGAFVSAIALPAVSDAAELRWEVKSNYRYKVQVAFYSQSRGHVWPGRNRAYPLNDYQTYTYTLDCVRGERICFGAWVTGRGNTYWGVGPDDKYTCTSCCAVCGGGPTRTQVLN